MAASEEVKDDKIVNNNVVDKEELKENEIEEEESSEESWLDPDPTFQEIYKMLSKPSKLMRKVTLIHDKIYLGGRKEVLDIEQLTELSITHIIHAAEDPTEQVDGKDHKFWTEWFGDSFEYLGFVSDDARKYPMIENHWSVCKEFLEKALTNEKTKVLIACRGGTNRSCTIVATALIQFYNMDCKEAIKTIHSKKFPVLTNNSFIKQIISFDLQIKK